MEFLVGPGMQLTSHHMATETEQHGLSGDRNLSIYEGVALSRIRQAHI